MIINREEYGRLEVELIEDSLGYYHVITKRDGRMVVNIPKGQYSEAIRAYLTQLDIIEEHLEEMEAEMQFEERQEGNYVADR